MASEIDIKILAKDLASSVIKGVTNATGSLASTVGNVGKAYANFGSTIATAGAVALGVGVAGLSALGMQAINTAGKFESMGVALETAFGGDKKAAKDAQDTITKFSAKTPYQLNEVLGSFIKLKNLGLDPSERALTSYGNTASSMGKSLDQMIEAVADASTLQFERLKEFGIRAEQSNGKVAFTFKGMKTTVKNDSKSIQDYLLKLGETNFAGGMDKQSKTLQGTLSTLADSWDLFIAGIAESSGLLDIAKGAVVALSEALSGDTAKNISNVIKAFVAFGQGMVYAVQDMEGFNDAFAYVYEIFPKTEPYIKRFSSILDTIFTFIKTNKKEVIEFAKIFGSLVGLSVVVGIIASLVNPFTLVLLAITAISVAVVVLRSLWEQNFMGIQDKATAFLGILQSIWSWISTYIMPLIVLFGQTVANVFMFLVQTWNEWNLTGIIIAGFQYLWSVVQTVLQGIGRLFEIVSLVIQGRWQEVGTKIVEYMNWSWERMKETWSKLGDFLGNIFKGAVGVIKDIINWGIIDPINRALGGLNKIITEANKIPGVSIGSVSAIPRLAQGVNNVPRDMVAMIHKGEAVVPAKMNPFNPNSQANGVGGNVTIQVIVQGTILGVNDLIETVARGVSEGQARSNKLARLNIQ